MDAYPSILEIFAVGVYASAYLEGADPRKMARATLEEFVRAARSQGMHIPTLIEISVSGTHRNDEELRMEPPLGVAPQL